MARILMVARPREGGAFEHVRALARALVEDGHVVALAGPHGGLPDVGVPTIALEMVRPLHPREDTRAIRDLHRIARSFKPDIVHAHGSKGSVMSRLARLASPRTPVVVTPHGFAFAGYFSSRSERLLYRSVETVLSPAASRVICVCEAEARLARSVGAGKRVRVVHNGIQPPEGPVPDPAVTALRSGDGPLIGVLSGLRPGKGLDTMLAAMPAIAASLPGARLAVAGEGAERAALEALAGRLGAAPAVTLLGQHPDPFSFLAAVDVFVLPSWAESFPYSVLEAMSVGLPIVATRVGGVAEAIEAGVSGILVAPRSADELSAALISLWADRARAAAVGAEARRRQHERFTLSRMVRGTVDVYEELL